ncbi:MAG: DUF930 domain-containing protein [Devosia sp.]|nr:DUF930 domain-containing protein [Devosia sp.]
MTDFAASSDPREGAGNGWPVGGARGWTIAASLATHALLLAVLLQFSATRPVEPPPIQSVDVQLVSAPDQPARGPAIDVSPTPEAPPPVEAADHPQPAPVQPAAPAQGAAPAAPGEGANGSGVIHPTHLLAGGLLKEAASRQVRKTLPTLAPSERVTQLCNIEATEQIRAAYPSSFPDTVAASAFGDTAVTGLTIEAPAAAYRSRQQWYAVSFTCTVAPDYQSVVDFRFRIGAAIPKDQWASHNLLAEDADE